MLKAILMSLLAGISISNFSCAMSQSDKELQESFLELRRRIPKKILEEWEIDTKNGNSWTVEDDIIRVGSFCCATSFVCKAAAPCILGQTACVEPITFSTLSCLCAGGILNGYGFIRKELKKEYYKHPGRSIQEMK